jgi:predicted transcriptional regulator
LLWRGSWHIADITVTIEVPDELQARIKAIAARTTLSPSELVEDALENGRSLDWYEHFLEDVEKGIAEADRGDYATDEEIARVLNKHRAA